VGDPSIFFTFGLNDGFVHAVTFYFLDWDTIHRRESISVFDDERGTLLDRRDLAEFHDGKYLSWLIRGKVRFAMTGSPLDGNVVVSGFFFDPSTFIPVGSIPRFSAAVIDSSPLRRKILLTWSAIPGRHYRVQQREELANDDWIDLPDDVVAQGETATAAHEISPDAVQKFYRVRLLP
jgi:hypothetical protein